MVKYKNILTAVNTKIKSKFPTIPILAESDVSEKIVRPSFMVMFDNMNTDNFMFDTADKECKVIIYYYASDKDKNKFENLDTIDDLNELFLQDNQLKIIQENNQSFFVGIEEVETDIVDKVLNYSFDLSFSQDWERSQDDGTELMENLQMKEELNV